MESIIVACITGVVTLIGVILSNSKSRAVMGVKLDALTEKVEKHNQVLERTYRLEQDMAVAVISPIMAALGGDGTYRRFRGVRHVGLNGIDISSWQDDLVVSAMGTCAFVIVKATGGAGYSNECFRRHADETLAAGKLLCCYHYARDRGYEGSAEAEADHFIDAFKPYVAKAIPFLDWEADALDLGTSLAKRWLERVKAKTGVTPGILKDFC